MDGLRISELARRVGVATSTVRYYERIGLLPVPARSGSGYRSYDADAEARLVFIARAKRLGLPLEAISELLAIWDGSNCGATRARLAALLEAKRVEIADQVHELECFSDQLSDVEAKLGANAAPAECAPDLTCCAPVPGASTPRHDRDEPIVVGCTLTTQERPARRAELADVSRGLTSWSRDERTLRLRFAADPDVLLRLRALTEREGECCAFLSFDIHEGSDELAWTIRAPALDSVAALDEFLPLLVPELEASEMRSGARDRAGPTRPR